MTAHVRSKTFADYAPFYLLGAIWLLLGCGASAKISVQSSQAGLPAGVNPPTITSASSMQIAEGTPFRYQITATNNPTSYAAEGLPQGLNLNSSSGVISGTPQSGGDYDVIVSARNASGEGMMHLFLSSTGEAGNCGAEIAPPQPAASAGFETLSFCDDFNSLSSVDTASTGRPGYNWYTNLPRWYPWRTLTSAYSINNSVLSVTSTGWTSNWTLSTMDPTTGSGHAWIYGYFEARISFGPAPGTNVQGWPAVWLFSAYHAETGSQFIWPELDIYEALTQDHAAYSGDFYGTIHQWQDSSTIHYQNSNNRQPTTVDWTQWHTVAVLWIPGQVTWYLDGKPLMTQQYSASAPPDPLAATTTGINPTPAGVFEVLDTQKPGMELILGSAPGWPMQVDWVKVWQQSY